MIVFRIPMGFLVNLRIAISKRVEITFSKIPMEKYLSKKKKLLYDNKKYLHQNIHNESY